VVIGLLCALPALLSLRVALACVADADLGWHLRAAEWILQHHSFPHADPFSRMGAQPWQAYSWLFELILYRLYGWWGLVGFMVYTTGLLVLIGAALYHLLSRLQTDFTKCALLATAAMICMARGYTPRPWLFSILFFILQLDILMHARRTGKVRELLWLPLIYIVWANVHIQFVDGLLVLGLAACEPLLARWWKAGDHRAPARALWITLGSCVLAACLNPYGPGIYKIAHALAAQPGVLYTVSEMNALPFRSFADYLVLFLTLAAAGVLARTRNFPPFETLLLAAAAVISFKSQRDVWFLALSTVTLLAAGLPGRPRKEEQPGEERSGEEQIGLPRWALLVSAAAAAACVFSCALILHVNNTRLSRQLAKVMPVQAVDVIRDRHYAGPVFNNYAWGGFLIWNLRQPVSIDGRAALYGDTRIDRSRSTWSGAPDWASDPELSSAGIVIAPDDQPLTQLLRSDSRFQLAYQDKIATVFVARKAPNPSAPAGATTVAGVTQPFTTAWRKNNAGSTE
jgi:hypothetical protein